MIQPTPPGHTKPIKRPARIKKTPEQLKRAKSIGARLCKYRKRYPTATPKEIAAYAAYITARPPHVLLTPEQRRYNTKLTQLRRLHPGWSDERLRLRCEYLVANPYHERGRTPKQKAAGVPLPRGRKRATAPEPKPVPAKVFPTTAGLIRCFVQEPEPGGKGYQKPFEILIKPDRLLIVQRKYEDRNARFRGPMS